MKRKIIKAVGIIIAVAGFLTVVGTAGVNDLAIEQGMQGLSVLETVMRSLAGLAMLAIGALILANSGRHARKKIRRAKQ